jgi:outer membrane receptor protein involved in Fe transport
MRLNDLIARIKLNNQPVYGYAVYKKENIDKGYIKGLEAEAAYEVTNALRLAGNISYTYGQSQTANEPLRRIPPLNGRVISQYTLKRWFGSLEYLFASKQDRLSQGDKDDNRIPKGGTPGYHLLNWYAGYTLDPAAIRIGLQNIFNEDYRTHGSGINGAGRSAWLSLTINL